MNMNSLTDGEKKTIASHMWERAGKNETDAANIFKELLDGFANLVSSTIKEIVNIGKKAP